MGEMGTGRVEAIWLKRAARGPMDPVEAAELVTNEGIKGDANRGRTNRQVTVIEREAFQRVCDDLPGVEPFMRRANVMVSGVRLSESRGRVLALGAARILLRGETRPCERMDEQRAGLRTALESGWSGGAHGVVLEGATVRVGDAAFLDPEAQ